MQSRRNITLICVAIVLILISCIGASFVQTQNGKVEISDVKLPMPNGEVLSVLVFKPLTATPENPAPCVVTSHGYFNSKEMQDITSVELARRGFVVFSMDIYHHGLSSGTRETYLYNREYFALGMLDLVDYIHDKINYVDSDRIGITGHSTGGRMVSYALDSYGRNERIAKGITNGAHYANEPANAARYKTKVSSALIVANFPVPYLLENIPDNVNVGITMGYYDEGAPMMLTKIDGYFWSDLSVSPQSKNFINTKHPGTFKLKKEIDYNTESGKPSIVLSDWDVNEKVEMGRFYGNPKDKNLRVIYNPREIHPLNHFSKESSAIMTDYFTATLGAPNPLPGNNQVWLTKELFNALGLVGFFIFILQITFALLQTPFFASLKGKVPAKLPALATGKSKTIFFGGLIISTIFGGASVMPLMQLNTKIFTNKALQNTNMWFSEPSTNQIMIWAIGNGLFALLMFYLTYKFINKKNGVTIDSIGVKSSLSNVAKALLLSVIAIVAGYNLLYFADMFFTTDFRLWTFAVKAIDSTKVMALLHYAPFFFIFYFANSLAINGANRVDGQKEWVNITFCALANVVGLVVVIFIQYAVMYSTGEAVWHPNLSWINVLLLIPFVPILIIATIYSRLLFNRTGSVYLPAFLNTLLITLITVANTTNIMTLQ